MDPLSESGEASATHHGGLATNVLGLWDGIVLGFASAAPGVSIAGVLGGLAGASGYGALLALLVGFLPLVFIALAFFHLNRWRVDAGISYAWIGRILNPLVGAFVGILIIIAFVVSNSFAIIPAATNFLTVFSSNAANNKWLVTVVGTVFLAVITLLVVAGIRLAARFQWVLTGFEMVVLTIFGILALRHGIAHNGHGGHTPTASWFSLNSAGGWSGLLAGLLISVFWYSGWETAVVVNEETRRARRNPGLAGIGSLLAVLVVSILFGAMFFAAVSPQAMSNNSAWLSALGLQLAGRPWGYLLVLAIMAGYLGGIETTIITFGNVGYSMGRDGVLWRAFGKVGDRTQMPWLAILVLSVPSFAMFIIQVWSGGSLATIVADLASSLGLMFVVYYALTAITAAWMLRGVARTNVAVAITGVALPLAGAVILAFIGAKTWGGTAAPIKVTFLVAVAASLIAVVVSRYRGNADFFHDKLQRTVTTEDLASDLA
ncbi:MAG TPA: APC family permease [Actinomycetes bacterium]|nr:APC family permease [Actinomycetes bacterium]